MLLGVKRPLNMLLLRGQRKGGFLRFFSSNSSSSGPLPLYLQKVESGLIKEDPHQLTALAHLQKLYDRLKGDFSRSSTAETETAQEMQASSGSNPATSSPSSGGGGWSDFFTSSSSTATQAVKKAASSFNVSSSPGSLGATKGVYLWGGPGCGKTFMMDIFYDSLDMDRKERIHFNDFMIKVHKRLHALKQDKSKDEAHLVETLADELIRDAYVLCFDEFQVTDIADAMILKSLLSSMIQKGCIVVATSNRPPSDLYKNGIQRALFVPFIHLLEERAYVHSMIESEVDYRKLVSQDCWHGMYMAPPSLTKRALFDQQFNKRTLLTPERRAIRGCAGPGTGSGHTDLPICAFDLMVYGHKMHIPHAIAGRRIAKFHFSDLCEEMLGAADFIDLGKAFSIVYIANVPVFDLTKRNEMRRMITLVDALYECGTLIYVLADTEPMELLAVSDEDRARSTHDELFAFDRTISRLLEMQSASYVEAWQKRYYPSEGAAGLKTAYPALLLEAQGGARRGLTSLSCLSNAQLETIYIDYNWGRGLEEEEQGETGGIRGEALAVLAGDIRELYASSDDDDGGGGGGGGGDVCGGEDDNNITEGRLYSFREFVALVRG